MAILSVLEDMMVRIDIVREDLCDLRASLLKAKVCLTSAQAVFYIDLAVGRRNVIPSCGMTSIFHHGVNLDEFLHI